MVHPYMSVVQNGTGRSLRIPQTLTAANNLMMDKQGSTYICVLFRFFSLNFAFLRSKFIRISGRVHAGG